jgi:hypothetical protein
MISRAGSDAPCTRPCQCQKGSSPTCKSPNHVLWCCCCCCCCCCSSLRLLHHGPPCLRCPPCPCPGPGLGPGPGRPTPQILTRTSRHTRLDNLVRPSSAVLQHPGSSTSTLGIIPFMLSSSAHTSASRVAGQGWHLGSHRRVGVLSGCPFITDIVMSGTFHSLHHSIHRRTFAPLTRWV